METKLDNSTLKGSSLLFWFVLIIPIAIIGLGVNFLFNPIGASAGFGIPIHDPVAFPYLWTKGVRDIFSGIVVLFFLLKGNRRTTATVFALSIFIRFVTALSFSRVAA